MTSPRLRRSQRVPSACLVRNLAASPPPRPSLTFSQSRPRLAPPPTAAPTEDIAAGGQIAHVAVSVTVADSMERCPVDLCCVIDISGSMNTIASYENDDGTYAGATLPAQLHSVTFHDLP